MRWAYGQGMQYLLGGLVLAFVTLVVIGGITGRLRATTCCTIADPRRDLRMRGAFEDDDLS